MLSLLIPGEPITSEAALKGGLVSRVYSSEELGSETERLANLIATKSNPVIKLGIKNFNRLTFFDYLNCFYCALL